MITVLFLSSNECTHREVSNQFVIVVGVCVCEKVVSQLFTYLLEALGLL